MILSNAMIPCVNNSTNPFSIIIIVLRQLWGATTLSIVTLSIISFNIMTLSIMTLSIMTLKIMTLSMMTLSIA
jgi:hypothetical protein